MTFFLPERLAGRVAMGSEARLVIDAVPQYVIPARITYVASVAQFTPKTVETESEREKLMFRVKARIAPELLNKRLEQVKTGLPGMAYVKLDADAEWPAHLQVNVTHEPAARAARAGGAGRGCQPAIRQDPRTGRSQRRPASPLHGWPDRPGRRRQVQPAGADRRRAQAAAGPGAGCSTATWAMPATAARVPAHRLHASGPGQEPLPKR